VWWTLPYALARSSQETASDLLFLLASDRMVASLVWCSVHPGVAVMNAFWIEQFRYPLSSMCLSHLFLRMVVNSFPVQGVKAIGLKLEGVVGSSVAAFLPISLMAAVLLADGIVAVVQQQLKRSTRAGSREGHLLKIW